MEIRPYREVKRKKTKVINVGKVLVGGDSPISVQSMTNTLTTNAKSTIDQINRLEEKGADIVRVSCPDESSTKSLKDITKNVNVNGGQTYETYIKTYTSGSYAASYPYETIFDTGLEGSADEKPLLGLHYNTTTTPNKYEVIVKGSDNAAVGAAVNPLP